MKRKNKNLYYGVSVDGLLLKVAELELDNNKIIIKKLQSHILDTPLINDIIDTPSFKIEPTRSNNEDLSFNNPTDQDISLDDIDIFNENTDINNNSNTVELNPTPDFTSEFNNDKLLKFFGQFDLINGKISLSCLEGKAQWKLIRLNKKATVKELTKLALAPEQIKDSSYNIDFLQNPDKSYYAVIHQGDFELMSLLNSTANIIYSKKHLYYQYIEPIEVSIMNIINLFYNSQDDSYTTILYIGNEAKLGIVINGKRIVKNFPIMIYDTDPEKVREAVFAKIMLEQESSEFPIIEKMILCGDYATEDDIRFYNEKTNYEHNLFFPLCRIEKKQKINIEIADDINVNTIPSFIVPIALALKGANPNYKEFNRFNLLPKRIIEAQKVFKIEWHGFLILALLFIVTVLGTSNCLKNQYMLEQLKNKYSVTSNEINTLKNFEILLKDYTEQISFYNTINSKIVSIANEKNSFSEVLYSLSEFTDKNPLCWIENFTSTDSKITIKGKSYHRNRISNLAKLFADGAISRINENKISSAVVWDFDISFSKPLGKFPETIQLPKYLESFEYFLEWYQEKHIQKFNIPQFEKKDVQQTPRVNERPQAKAVEITISFEDLYNQARDNYLSGNFEITIRSIHTVIEEYREHKDIDLAYYLLGETYYVLSEFNEASKNFLAVIDLKKNKLPEAYFFLGKSYEALTDYDRAISTYTELIRLYPENALSKTAEEQLKNLFGEYE